jgi:hypothetical protein
MAYMFILYSHLWSFPKKYILCYLLLSLFLTLMYVSLCTYKLTKNHQIRALRCVIFKKFNKVHRCSSVPPSHGPNNYENTKP